MLNAVHQPAKNVHFLGKFRILPKVILVMILQDQGDSICCRIGQACLDAFHSQPDALINAQFRSPLSGEHPAVRTAQGMCHIDPTFLFPDLIFTKFPVRVGKVGRTTHHRDYFPMILYLPAKTGPVLFILHFQKTGIPLQSVDIQPNRHFNPFGYGQGTIFT